MTNRIFTVGREGHIRIQDQTVSRQHASILIGNDSIYLRDLNSTNGTFLVKNNRLVLFFEGYVQLNQMITLGNIRCSVQQLLDLVGEDQISSEDGTTKLGKGPRPFHLNHPRNRKDFPILTQ